jgi:hypothetical protein
VFTYLEGLVQKTTRILRRGKRLQEEAHIASTNERNEYGRAILVRRQPFRSSSSDLVQASTRSNGDLQFMDRACPVETQKPGESESAADEAASAERNTSKSNTFYAVPYLTALQAWFMLSLKMGMKASFICDFYMTKYAAKAQQVLSSALGPLMQGLRRFEEEQAEATTEKSDGEKALAKLRRLVFSANKCHWFSACELAVYVQTGGHCILTHQDQVLFLSRPHYLMHQCKRILEGEKEQSETKTAQCVQVDVYAVEPQQETTRQDGSDKRRVTEPTPAETHSAFVADIPSEETLDSVKLPGYFKYYVEKCGGILAFRRKIASVAQNICGGDWHQQDCERVATDVAKHLQIEEEIDTEEEALYYCNVFESVWQERRSSESTDGVEALEKSEPTTELLIPHISTSNRDDWLHRGPDLFDMNWFTYVKFFERVRRPKSVSRRMDGYKFFPFEEHYALAARYCQKLRANPRVIPRTVGAQCVPDNVENGEPHALYKATLFTPLRCLGVDHCSDPLVCRDALCDIGGRHTFKGSFKQMRAHIEVAATSGQQKADLAKKIPTLADCTLFKQWTFQTNKANADDKARHTIEGPQGCQHIALRRSVQLLIRKYAFDEATLQCRSPGHLWERPVANIIGCLVDNVGYHPHQLFLGEFVGVLTREVLFHMDLDIQARNTAVMKAKSLAGCTVEETGECEEAPPPMEFEDVGGHIQEELSDEEDATVLLPKGIVVDRLTDWRDIQKLLAKDEEISSTRKPGRPAEAHKNMRAVADVFGDTLDTLFSSFDASRQCRVHFDDAMDDVLRLQRHRAELLRKQKTEGVKAELVEEECFAGATNAAEPTVSLFDDDCVSRGPALSYSKTQVFFKTLPPKNETARGFQLFCINSGTRIAIPNSNILFPITSDDILLA